MAVKALYDYDFPSKDRQEVFGDDILVNVMWTNNMMFASAKPSFRLCSKAYASAIRRGSLQAMPVKLTPNGPGLAAKPSGKDVAFGTIANGTMTVG